MYEPMSKNPGSVGWVDAAAKEIASEFVHRNYDESLAFIAEAIERHWERSIANVVPVSMEAWMDQSQAMMHIAKTALHKLKDHLEEDGGGTCDITTMHQIIVKALEGMK